MLLNGGGMFGLNIGGGIPIGGPLVRNGTDDPEAPGGILNIGGIVVAISENFVRYW